MTNEDVCITVRQSLRFDGNAIKLVGLIFLAIPVILLLLGLGDHFSASPTITKSNLYFLWVPVCLLPGIFLIWRGIRISDPRRNKVFITYLHAPENITWVYEKHLMLNGRPTYKVILLDNRKNELTIESNITDYRLLGAYMARQCVNAVHGYNETWKPIYRSHPDTFKEILLKRTV